MARVLLSVSMSILVSVAALMRSRSEEGRWETLRTDHVARAHLHVKVSANFEKSNIERKRGRM